MSIPLGPVRLPPEDDRPRGSPTAPSRQPGLFRRGLRGVGWLLSPLDWFGRREVSRGGADIAALARALRQSPARDKRLHLEEGDTFDLRATAFSYGIRVEELRERLGRRRRQTARLAWGFWAIAGLSLVAWVWTALGIEGSALRWLSLLQFLPFVLLFWLLGIREALTNFQIRTMRAAGVREWLLADGGFWPR